MRGGKAYKKGKKSGPSEDVIAKFSAREEGQDYARAVRMLGGRRVICFCNDGIERVGKIRGALCKRSSPQYQRIEMGDILLITFREFEGADDSCSEQETEEGGAVAVLASGRKEICDIIYKYHRSHWKYIKKDPPIHRLLLLTTGAGGVVDPEDDEELFDHDGAEEYKEGGGGEDGKELTEADIDAI